MLLILIAELGVLAWVLASQSFSWSQFGLRSIAVQWIVLLSAMLLCRVRAYLPQMSLRMGWVTCFAIIELTGLAVIALGSVLLDLDINALGLFQLSLAIAILAGMVLRYFQLLQRVLEHNQAEMSSRMDALQARIKPHFLFNSLTTIAELIASRPDDAEIAVENLSSLFRANLKETSSFCPLSDEVTLVKGYLELEKWRLGDRLTIEWRESVRDDKWPVPVLCLQPLVENAVLHGVASQAQGGTIIISVLQTPRVTTLSVENSIGTISETHKGHGVGLENVKRRLSVLYGSRARCQVEKTDKLYKVNVIIPKQDMEQSA